MGVSFYFDPFTILFRIFEEQWPDKSAIVELGAAVHEDDDDARGCKGATSFDHDPPRICIFGDVPIFHAVEILAHELAHVAAGYEDDHGSEFEAAFALIHERYCAEVDALQVAMGDEKVGAVEDSKS